MDRSKLRPTRLSKLRTEAEAVLGKAPPPVPENMTENARNLLHELWTHQIELEMQNEELRRAQEELIEARDRYSDLYDFAPIGYLTLEQNGIICQANLTLAKMLGVGRSRILNSPLSNFILKEDQDVLYRLRRKVIETKRPQTCELRMRSKDGPFWARMESTLTETNDDSLRLQIVINNISDVKEAAERENLLRADLAHMARLTAMGELASELAHELNQPLAAVTMFAEMIGRRLNSDGTLDRKQLAESCEKLAAQALRAGELVRRMRHFATKAAPGQSSVEISQIFADIIPLVKNECRHANIEIDVDFGNPLPTIMADKIQVEQVMLNLIQNALEAMQQSDRESHRLSIRVTEWKNSLRFAVSDSGIGISGYEIDDLFGAFYTTKSEGMGMGLSICRSIIEAHGGKIWAEGNPDRGAVFSFTLPVAEK